MKSKIYGYVRISTQKQSIERQIRNIKNEYPNAIIVQEIYTGTKIIERKEFSKLLKRLKSGDTLVCDSVSRFSRDSEEGFKLYEKLFNQGVNLVFLKESYVNSDVYKQSLNIELPSTSDEIANIFLEASKKAMMLLAKRQIQEAFRQSEKEVKDLQQRTKEGIETARLNGKQIGGVEGKKLTTKKSIKAKELIKKHNKCFNGYLNDKDTIKLIKGELGAIANNSYYKYKREINQEEEQELQKKLNKYDIMPNQVDVEEVVEAKLEELDKVNKSTAQKGAVDESTITSEQDVEKNNLCKSSIEDENKEVKKQAKSNKRNNEDYDMGIIAKALEEALEADSKPKDDRKLSLQDYCLSKFSPQDSITVTKVRKWLDSKEAKRVKEYWNCKDVELANLLLELNIKVRIKNKEIKRFYTDCNNNLAYWFL